MRVGLIGAGNISTQYLENLCKAKTVEVVMVSDLDRQRAEQRAKEYGVANHGGPEELLAREDIELVINLTIPKAHEEVSTAALNSGKHVWSEKPLALNSEAVGRLQELAKSKNLQLGCAPDTFLGPGIQTGLRLIAQGLIGTPLSATTAFEVPGPESWHPSPDFLYAKGGGPIFDMGPYYLTGLVCALGPIAKVQAISNAAQPSRVIGSGPRAGESFPVEVPTNVFALYTFAKGFIAQSSFSFDSARVRAGVLEVHGTKGSLAFTDPNNFDGKLRFFEHGASDIGGEELECEGVVMSRGVGVVEMVQAIRQGRSPRANADLAGHVVDVMQATEQSSLTGESVVLTSKPAKPAILDTDFNPWE